MLCTTPVTLLFVNSQQDREPLPRQKVLALFTAEENSVYVGSILTGASPSMHLRQYVFGDRNVNRISNYTILRSRLLSSVGL